jgi:hypothetical protein
MQADRCVLCRHFVNLSKSALRLQVPMISGNWGLIDKDTPNDALTTKSYVDPNQELQLVFSDEFNVDGRTFYPGDDPYWEAVDLHYWAVRRMSIHDVIPLTALCRQTIWSGMIQKPSPLKMAICRLRFLRKRPMV